MQNIIILRKKILVLLRLWGWLSFHHVLKKKWKVWQNVIVNKKDIASVEELKKHAAWVEGFLPKYTEITQGNVWNILEKEVGEVFVKVLEDAGVYKCTDEGIKAFKRFISTL